MSKARKTINGYRLPSARLCVAVAKACQIITERPGIPQRELLEQTSRWLKMPAGWLGSASARSPAGLLWERKKVGRSYRCYPNEHTSAMGDPRAWAAEAAVAIIDKDWRAAGCPQPGDLVTYIRPSMFVDHVPKLGIFVGFEINSYGPNVACLGGRERLEDLELYNNGPITGMWSQIIVNGMPETAYTGDLHKA